MHRLVHQIRKFTHSPTRIPSFSSLARAGTEARIKAMHPSLTTVKRDTVELQSELTAVMGRLEKLTAHVHTIEQKLGTQRGGGGGGDDEVKHALSQFASRVGAVESKVAALSSAGGHHSSSAAAAAPPPRSDYASASSPDAATYPPRQQIERIELALAQSDEALKLAEDARRRCMVLEPQCVKTVALVTALEANVHDCQLGVAAKADRASIDQQTRTLGVLQLALDDKVSKAALDSLTAFSQRLASDFADMSRRQRDETMRAEEGRDDARRADEALTTLQRGLRTVESELRDLANSVQAIEQSATRGGGGGGNNRPSSSSSAATLHPPTVFVEQQNGAVTKMYVDEQLRRIYENLYKFREEMNREILMLNNALAASANPSVPLAVRGISTDKVALLTASPLSSAVPTGGAVSSISSSSSSLTSSLGGLSSPSAAAAAAKHHNVGRARPHTQNQNLVYRSASPRSRLRTMAAAAASSAPSAEPERDYYTLDGQQHARSHVGSTAPPPHGTSGGGFASTSPSRVAPALPRSGDASATGTTSATATGIASATGAGSSTAAVSNLTAPPEFEAYQRQFAEQQEMLRHQQRQLQYLQEQQIHQHHMQEQQLAAQAVTQLLQQQQQALQQQTLGTIALNHTNAAATRYSNYGGDPRISAAPGAQQYAAPSFPAGASAAYPLGASVNSGGPFSHGPQPLSSVVALDRPGSAHGGNGGSKPKQSAAAARLAGVRPSTASIQVLYMGADYCMHTV